MKKLSTIALVLIVIFAVVNFDSIVVFILAGAIPAINLVIPATTMLSLIAASGIIIPFFKRRQRVVSYGLVLYDRFIAKKSTHRTHLPKRRYQEL